MCWTYFKTIVHSLKILVPSQITLRPPIVSQAGYGPELSSKFVTEAGVMAIWEVAPAPFPDSNGFTK